MKDHAPYDWRVEIQESGRDGYIIYHEQSHSISFYWEFGGGDVVAIVHIGQASAWNTRHPWAADRQPEIVERVIGEVIRQRAPSCRADIDEAGGFIYFR